MPQTPLKPSKPSLSKSHKSHNTKPTRHRTIPPKNPTLLSQRKITKKYTAGLTSKTERALAEKAGHLEMIVGGKKGKGKGKGKEGIKGKEMEKEKEKDKEKSKGKDGK